MQFLYSSYAEEDLKKEVLMGDQDFLTDASNFLAKRKNLDLVDPEEIYDNYIEHMRQSDVNELDTIGDLMYAQEASDEDKSEMRRLYDTWDRMPIDLTDDLGGKIMDYGEGLLTAPSTYLSIATGGGAKLGTVAAQQAAKVATKEIIKRGVLSSATKAMLVDGGIGAVQGGVSEGVRVEVSPDREFTGSGVLVGGIAGAIPGVALGGTTGYVTTRQAIKSNELAVQTQRNVAERVAKAESAADATIEANRSTASIVSNILRPIDPEMVARGEAGRELLPAELAVSKLNPSTRKRLVGAVTELAGQLKPEPGERITETIVRSLRSSPDVQAKLSDIMEKYDISSEQLFDVFSADVSDAGRTLGEVGRVKQLINEAMSIANDVGVRVERGELEALSKQGSGAVLSSVSKTANGAEKMRRAILTSQVQTSVRNFVGGGARVFTDVVENFIEDKTAKVMKVLGFNYDKSSFKPDSMAIAKYLFNQEEASLIVNMYRQNNPQAADRLFKTFLDATELAGAVKPGTRMEALGMKINFLNRMSDNYYKRAIFAGELQRLVKVKYGKNVTDMMLDGSFNRIDPKIFNAAGDKAFELVYQSTPSGKGEGFTGFLSATAKKYLEKVDNTAGLNMITGAIVPFPRFVINQVKFMYDHAPVIGLLNATGETAPKKIAQQLSGYGLIGGAMYMRAQEGTDMEWYEVTDEQGKRMDLRPVLGPFNMFMYIGDALYRWNTGQKVQDKWVADAIEMSIGSSARAGTGQYLLEKFGPEATAALEGEQEWTEKSKRMVGRMLGDYAATFSYAMPLSIARDLFKLTEEEARLIPETNGEVQFIDIFMARATRALPEPVREQLAGDTKRRYGITSPHPTRSQDPVRTMVTGFSRQAPATPFEKELARLKMDTYDIYKPIPFGPADVIVRKALSEKLPRLGNELVQSLRYKNAVNDYDREMLVKELQEKVIAPERKKAFMLLHERARNGEMKLDPKFGEDQIFKFEYESLPKPMRKSIEGYFKQMKKRTLGGEGYKKGDYAYAVRVLQREVKESQDISQITRTAEPQKFNEGGLVGKTRSGQKIYDSGANDATKEALGLALDLAPVTGEIRSAIGALEDFEQGNYGMAALGALGAAPAVGAPARAIRKGLGAKKLLDDLPPPEAAQKTQIAGTLPTYVKAKKELDSVKPEGKTLDFGAGLGIGAKEMDADSYEPFAREGFNPTFTKSTDIPSESYDKVTNLNVLNVVPKEVRDDIVKEIGRVLKPGGTAVITTRGKDVLTAKGRKGPEENSVITTSGTYQKGFTKAELEEYVKETLGEGFDIKRLNLGKAGVTVTKK